MALVIEGSGPINGTMARGQTLAQRLQSIPGFVGAWNMEGLTEQEDVTSWPATVGGAVFTQAAGGRFPAIRSIVGLGLGFQFSGGQSLYLPAGLFTDGEPLTVAMQVMLLEPATDIQYLTALGSAYRTIWRTGSGGRYQFDGANDVFITPPNPASPTPVYLNQTPTTTRLDIAGVQGSAENPGSAGSQLVIGGNLPTITGNGWRGGISRVVVARSATLGTVHEQYIRSWLAR